MPTPFIMPKMDMDQEKVTIIEWLKKEGEQVEKGEPVLVIETDKITSEVEAPASGTLARVLYAENEEAPVTETIAYILEADETEADLPGKAEPKTSVGVKSDESTLTIDNSQIPASAVAKRIAEEQGIDLVKVPFSGKKILKQDIETYLKSTENEKVEPGVETTATPAARRIAIEKGIRIDRVSGTGPRGRVQAVDVESFTSKPAGLAASFENGEIMPINNMRRRIAERLTSSYQNTPHIFLKVEVDMSQVETSRKQMNEQAKKKGSPKISLTAYLIKIVSWCLKQHPYLNTTFRNEEIIFWKDINIGIATALEDGLIVPVIRNADQLSLSQINNELLSMTERARKGTLTLKEVQDGTFTISNLGMYGIHSFTTIINPPESAILAVGALRRCPIVIDEKDTIQVRPVMTLTLGVDHRIIDGAVAASFMADLAKSLETPSMLLY